MAMRITSNMATSQTLRNLNANRANMADLSEQSSTGKKINKPSDDPIGTTYALRYRAELSANEQYQRNTNEALSWLDYTDTVMGQASDVMKRLKELTTQAGTGTTDENGLAAIKDEIVELKKQLVNVGNSQLTGKYIFNGQDSDTKPYELNATTTNLANVVTDKQGVAYGISEQVSIEVSTSGNRFFGNPGDADNIFSVMDRLTAAMDNQNYDDISAEMKNIDSRTDKMITARSEIGAKTNRIELVQNRLQDRELNVTNLQAKVEDADIPETLINATTAQTVYQSALKTAASIMQVSLVDFIR